MRDELNKQAPAEAVKACIRARLAYLFVAKDELHQKAIKASFVKKIRKNEIEPDANKGNFEGNSQIPTGTRQNQQRRNRDAESRKQQQRQCQKPGMLFRKTVKCR